jgi:hypothetical protein
MGIVSPIFIKWSESNTSPGGKMRERLVPVVRQAQWARIKAAIDELSIKETWARLKIR